MPMPTSHDNQPRRALLLTGASRGIGHATVKRFSAAGWRVITCSRHPFPENCPWEMGPEDHIQVDLADPDTTIRSPGNEEIVAHPAPLHRLGTPDEVAKIIYVLCTETSSYVNGAEIHINGGQHV